MHGLIFETSVCYWQNQPGCYLKSLARRNEGRKETPDYKLPKEQSEVLLRGEQEAPFLMIRMRAHAFLTSH